MNMLIRGELDNRRILEAMLGMEWQLKIRWKDRFVLIAFYKGDWNIEKYLDDAEIPWRSFTLSDCLYPFAEDNLLMGLLEQRIEARKGREETVMGRENPPRVICDVLDVWVGRLNDIVSIEVVQAGRDGYLDSDGIIHI